MTSTASNCGPCARPTWSGTTTHPDKLLPHEAASLAHVLDEVRGGSILDIGVSAGRTVKALLQVSPDYLGIDYSQEMIAACHARYPGIRFAHADAR